MEANEFVSKLKADSSKADYNDLENGIKEYQMILQKLNEKDRGSFSLNVLCIICRNIDKVPNWSNSIDKSQLLTLSMQCINETLNLATADQVKILACTYHIHRLVVKQPSKIPPELLLKFSYVPFETDSNRLMKEYCKTYWNILSDRLIYIERLKSSKFNIKKLLQKLISDVTKIIEIYDPKLFSNNLLVFLTKKLFFLYNDVDGDNLNLGLKKIFESLSKIDGKVFKKLKEKDVFDLYAKFSECIYVVADSSTRIDCRDSILNSIVKSVLTILGHNKEVLHCLQNFYINGFCTILTENIDYQMLSTTLVGFLHNFEITEKLGYKNILKITLPFTNQLFRLTVEYLLKKHTKIKLDIFTMDVCEKSLEIILLFMKNLKECQQLLKCENCNVKSAYHDALRLSFSAKSIFNIVLNNDITKSILDVFVNIVNEQHYILNELSQLGCENHERCLKKTLTDIHNIAILLNKNKNYDYSIKLFDLYLKKEIESQKTDSDIKNISRAFYNKSICELDYKLFDNSLKSAYLSLIFAQPEGLKSEKYISLVIDIKAKLLKSDSNIKNEIQNGDKIANGGSKIQDGVVEIQDGVDKNMDVTDEDRKQLLTVLDIALSMVQTETFGDLTKYFSSIKFSALIQHEYKLYAALWPSVVPIAGCWRTLLHLINGGLPDWIQKESYEDILDILFEIILETPSMVRTIDNNYFMKVVYELVEILKNKKKNTIKTKMVYATLLLLKSEYDLSNASKKYNWKILHPNIDPDQAQLNRTILQEYNALKNALKSVELFTRLLPEIRQIDKLEPYLSNILKIMEVYVPLLLYYSQTSYGLQLALICCVIAKLLKDGNSYIKSVAMILSYAAKTNDNLKEIIDTGSLYIKELLIKNESMENALIFLCECGILALKSESYESGAKILNKVQNTITAALERDPNVNLDMAIGKLLTAQTTICQLVNDTNILSCVLGTQRHYLTVSNTESKWTARHYRSLNIKLYISTASVSTVHICKCLLLWRRARSAAGVALPTASALTQARIYADIICTHKVDDAQIKIDHRLKHILGIQPWNETQPYTVTQDSKTTAKKPSKPQPQIETMLEVKIPKKTPTSPTILCNNVPVFKIPVFLTHDDICQCHACQTPACLLLTCQMVGLQAATYFRASEFDVARDYFNGFLECCQSFDRKLSSFEKRCRKISFDSFLTNLAVNDMKDWFRHVQIEILIEFAFLELSQKQFDKSDSIIVQIHEIIGSETIDLYLSNEVQYLLAVSAFLRKGVIKKPIEVKEIEEALEVLKLSPQKTEILKTPESKITKILKLTKKTVTGIKVPDEEVPNTKRRVIKLNLDDNSDEKPESSKKPVRKPSKVPIPKTSKPAIEIITPKPKTKPRPKLN